MKKKKLFAPNWEVIHRTTLSRLAYAVRTHRMSEEQAGIIRDALSLTSADGFYLHVQLTYENECAYKEILSPMRKRLEDVKQLLVVGADKEVIARIVVSLEGDCTAVRVFHNRVFKKGGETYATGGDVS